MFKKSAWAGVILTLIAVPTFAAFSAAPAEAAVVYCKTAGVPQGCVVRPVAPVVVPIGPVAPLAPVGVAHVGYTHVGPVTGVTHVGATRVRW